MRSFGDDWMSVVFGLLSWQFHAKVYVSVSSQIQYTKSEQLSCLVKAQVVHSTVLPRTRVVSGWHGVSAADTGCQRLARGVSGWHGVSAAGTGCQRLARGVSGCLCGIKSVRSVQLRISAGFIVVCK